MILKRKSILKSSSFKIIKNEKKKKKNHILVMLDKWAFFFFLEIICIFIEFINTGIRTWIRNVHHLLPLDLKLEYYFKLRSIH